MRDEVFEITRDGDDGHRGALRSALNRGRRARVVDPKCVMSRRRRNEDMSAADPIRVLLSKEGEHWVAQCLEYDIGAQARDLGELRKRLLIAIRAERDESLRRHGKPFAGIGPTSLP
jgi:hypothetical protein